jgi:hypothetical protein
VNEQDIKLAILNIFSFTLSLSNIEMLLKIILLIVSITYTLIKINQFLKENKKDKV